MPNPPTTGTDAIRVAMLYKPASLRLVGPARSDTDPVHNRPPLAQTFAAANGERFSVVVNHFKSKGGCDKATGGDADSGDGQACFNATRIESARRLNEWLAEKGWTMESFETSHFYSDSINDLPLLEQQRQRHLDRHHPRRQRQPGGQ